MTPATQTRDGRPAPPKPAQSIQPAPPKPAQSIQPTPPKPAQSIQPAPPKPAQSIQPAPPKPARGIQLTLAARPAPYAPSRVLALPHPPCLICAGPTARHAGRAVCVVCGHGARDARPPHHPRRHPN